MTNDPLGLTIPTVEASGAIFNPWYQLPRIHIVSSAPATPEHDPNPPVTPVCRAEVPQHHLTLFFGKDTITFVGGKPETHRLVQPVLIFIAYSTFIHYNVWWPTSKIPSEAEYPLLDSVPFTLERIIRVERESVSDGKSVKTMHFEGHRENRELAVNSVSTFLTILNRPLYASLMFYLRGCANPMYFLMDYYKAVESVVKAYGTQKLFFEKLRQYGITKGRHSDFTKAANADPVDIGRHAPEFGAAIYSFDIKTMMYDPRSREIFEDSTTYCRDVVAGYIAALSVGFKP